MINLKTKHTSSHCWLKPHNTQHPHANICLTQTPFTYFALQPIRVNATRAIAELTVL